MKVTGKMDRFRVKLDFRDLYKALGDELVIEYRQAIQHVKDTGQLEASVQYTPGRRSVSCRGYRRREGKAKNRQANRLVYNSLAAAGRIDKINEVAARIGVMRNLEDAVAGELDAQLKDGRAELIQQALIKISKG